MESVKTLVYTVISVAYNDASDKVTVGAFSDSLAAISVADEFNEEDYAKNGANRNRIYIVERKFINVD